MPEDNEFALDRDFPGRSPPPPTRSWKARICPVLTKERNCRHTLHRSLARQVWPQLAHRAAGAPGVGDDVAFGPWIGWINEILMQAGDPGSALAPLDVAARRAVKAYRACRNAAAAASQAAEEQSSAAPLSSTTEE